MLNKWEPVLSLIAGIAALCMDRWYDPEGGSWFYLGMIILIIETARLGIKARAAA